MRLLIIAPEQLSVPPSVGGSVEHSIYSIAKNISSEHKVTILSKRRANLPYKSSLGNVTIIRVQGSTRDSYLRNALKKVAHRHYDMIQIDNRPRFVKRVRKVFPTTPIAVFLHSVTFISPPMTSLKQAANDLGYADLIIGNSSSLKKTILKRFPNLRNKVHYVHLGVNLKEYRPPTLQVRIHARRKHKVSGRFAILFAGRLIPRKGIPVLMKAVKTVQKSVPSVKLLVAGGTGKRAYKAYLQRLGQTLNIPVSFKGYVSRSEMPRFYWSGDCFVCPSQGLEAFGLVNVEAMASGLPCIASKNGGIAEIIKHDQNGLLVDDFSNPKQFAKQIIRVAHNSKIAKRLAKQAREDVLARFSWKNTANKLIKIYSSKKEDKGVISNANNVREQVDQDEITTEKP
ncbi:glycosyltransferase family 4 protein [Paenibacillus cremeus]|nr:glycosyltransferase family 4 protein [Paenibacillus cremeus]